MAYWIRTGKIMKLGFRNLISELQFLIIIISMIMVIIILGISLLIISNNMLAELTTRSLGTAYEMEALLEYPLYAVDDNEAKRICETFLSSGKISGVELESAASGVILSKIAEKRSSRIPRISRDISREGLQLGKITLTFSDHEIKRTQSRFGIIALIIIIAVLLTNIIANRLIITRRITKPFNAIISTIKNISEGDYKTRIDKTSYRDLNVIVSFFNDMAEKVHLKSQEQKKIEEALRESERKARAILDLSLGFIGLLSPDGIVIEANQAALDFADARPEDIIGKPFWETPWWTHSPDMQKRLREAVRLAALGELARFEATHMDSEGTLHTFDFSLKPIKDETGKVIMLIPEGHDVTERNKAEEALYQSERRFRSIIQESLDMIVILDKNGNVTYESPSTSVILGYNPGYWIGRSPMASIHPEDLPSVQRDLNEVFSGVNDRRPSAFRIKRADGEWIHLEAVGNNQLRNPSVQGVVITLRDITERKKAEEDLNKSEEKYRELVENANSIILRMDVTGNITFFNEYALRFFGFSHDEVMGRNVVGTIVPLTDSSGKDLANMILDIGINPEKYASNENENICKDGRRVWVSWTNKPILDDHGKCVEILCVGNDITQLKKANELLKESEERYRKIIDTTSEWIWEMDLSGKHTYSNPGSISILGYEQREFVGQRADFLLHEEDRAEVNARLPQLIKEKKGWKGWVLRWRHKDGTYRYLESNASPIFDSDGELTGYLGADRDITDRIKAEEEKEKLMLQLYQSQKMESVGRLAGGVAHDFNNMLSAILGHTELAMMKTDQSDPICGDLKAIQTAALRSAELTRQLLAFARKQTVLPRVLDLNNTIEGMLKMLVRLIGEDIDLVWMPGKNLWPVKIDPSQIDQMLVNLCINARDAIKGAGKITIESGNISFDRDYCSVHPGFIPGEYVMMAVSDNGAGMSKEVLEHLFEPFYTTKDVGKGTGLGLATIYGIVKQNNGFVNVYSEPGAGTTFRIYLPREMEADPEMLPETVFETPMGHGETILLVEDEPTILDVTRAMLQKLGYRVLPAGVPGEALRLSKEHAGDIDLMITDVIMPEVNGKDLCGLIMEVRAGMKCLFTSGYTANTIAHHGVLDQDVHFIQKPFSMHDLAVKVREALGN